MKREDAWEVRIPNCYATPIQISILCQEFFYLPCLFKMTICFVVVEIEYFLTHRFALAKEISNKHNVVLITDPSKGKPEDFLKLESAGIEIIPLKKRPNTSILIGYARYIFELKRKIKTCSPEYIFYTGIEISMFGALIHRLISTKKAFFLITGIGAFLFSK